MFAGTALSLAIWVSQMALGPTVPVEVIVEQHVAGTYVGAITPDESAGSWGALIAPDGSITIEDRR